MVFSEQTDTRKPLVFVCCVIFIVILILLFYNSKSLKEKFTYLMPFKDRYCDNCSTLSPTDCSKCINCGYCITADGNGECVPGDRDGPYFREDCARWFPYGDAIVFPTVPQTVNYTYWPVRNYWNTWWGSWNPYSYPLYNTNYIYNRNNRVNKRIDTRSNRTDTRTTRRTNRDGKRTRTGERTVKKAGGSGRTGRTSRR